MASRSGEDTSPEPEMPQTRLNFSEATDFLQGLAAGHHPARTVQPCTILLALIAEECEAVVEALAD